MNNLQWGLVILGVLVVVGIYIYSRGLGGGETMSDEGDSDPWAELLNEDLDEKTASPVTKDNHASHEQPRTKDAPAATTAAPSIDTPEPAPPEDAPVIHMSTPSSGEEKLVVLHVDFERRVDGAQIHAALKACGLYYGPRSIYHRTESVEGAEISVFCVANMLKPGYLDPAEAGDFSTRGLSLFLILPGPVAGTRAYHDMLKTARQLAEQLDGSVLDEKKTPLNQQMVQYLHEDVVAFEHRCAAQG